MTLAFCTILDAAYLAQGLVLLRSLRRVETPFDIYALCMDTTSESLLHALALPGVVPVSVSDLEAQHGDFRAVKQMRTRAEYAWTAKPVFCEHLLDGGSIDAVVLLDADLVFFTDLTSILDELSDASVLITPHRYADECRDWAETWGTYNSQLVAFRRDGEGLRAVRWWKKRCLEWCHEQPEPGLYGDQKHLDDWPDRFERVRVLEDEAAGVAPWNSRRYRIDGVDDPDRPLVDGRPIIFYHCASLRLVAGLTLARRCGLFASSYRLTRDASGGHVVWTTTYDLTTEERVAIWDRYVVEVAAATRDLIRVDPTFNAGVERLRPIDVAATAARRGLARHVRAASARSFRT